RGVRVIFPLKTGLFRVTHAFFLELLLSLGRSLLAQSFRPVPLLGNPLRRSLNSYALVASLTKYLFVSYNREMKRSTQFRLTDQARALLDAMSKADGISHTAMLEIAIREAAKKRGIRADSGIQAQSQPGPAERH